MKKKDKAICIKLWMLKSIVIMMMMEKRSGLIKKRLLMKTMGSILMKINILMNKIINKFNSNNHNRNHSNSMNNNSPH